MKKISWPLIFSISFNVFSQPLTTPFEQSKGTQTATYFECIRFYQQLDKRSSKILMREMGPSDAGYPLHLVLYSNDGVFDPVQWHLQKKCVILINNGIHPGEPDGVDACMMLLRDLVSRKISIPDNVALAVIPLYNIGGALNRGSFSRVNQNGPQAYGFRGNSQNLDLNRDFTKMDSRETRSFVHIFHWLNPEIQVDNHVSDGADYQHTMTLITTQWNKLGGGLGKYVHDILDPWLYESMQKKGWPMCPYVNFEEGSPEKGWDAFFDSPRYSSGYAALWNTISYIPETHMLKPFKDRVAATYALMVSMIDMASVHSAEIIRKKQQDTQESIQKNEWALSWKVDTTRFDSILFKGYEALHRASDVTGLDRLYYDHQKPFEKEVRFYNYFTGEDNILSPAAYIIPQGWHEVTDFLKLNGVTMHPFNNDTTISVEAYHISDTHSASRAYEKHHRNMSTRVTVSIQQIRFLKGDYLVPASQPAKRFLVEMLEPTGDDSYFSWNFFDAILQQKEGYSDYRWEDVAAAWLKDHPDLKKQLDQQKQTDTAFANNPAAQLEFVYRHSPYYEPAHLRYPVYRLPK